MQKVIGKSKETPKQVRFTKICTTYDLQNEAMTVKLFDNTIWANLGDGSFQKRGTKSKRDILSLYSEIRTAVTSGQKVFAKRRKKTDALCYLSQCYKLNNYRKVR